MCITRPFFVSLLALFAAPIAIGQGVIGDLLAGKLVNPKVGQWAWYDLLDATGGKRYVIRQAVVGEEKLDRKTGFWVEFEIVPEVGFKSVYKMLLTGPASDPKNIHRIIRKQGPDPVEEVSPAEAPSADTDKAPVKRKSLGMDTVTTPSGLLRAEHFTVTKGSGTLDLWVNDQIPPTGVVRMKSRDGDMVLRNYGSGGRDAQSVLDSAVKTSADQQRPKVIVGEGAVEPQPAPQSGEKK